MGGFQGYLNPLPYLVPYALRHALAPLPAALALAVLQSALVPVAWVVAGRLVPAGLRGRAAIRALATLAGSTGAATLSEVGTSFADLPLAILVLAGLAALLRAEADGPATPRPVLAALLVGAATGLKLTNAVFAIGLLAAGLVPPPHRPWRAAGVLVAGLAAGFAATGGAWAAYLAWRLGNPVFPAMNTLFRSASAALSDYVDGRFLPGGVRDALAYPALIAAGLHPTAEVPFAEPRLLLAALAVAALALAAVIRRAAPQPGRMRLVRAAVFCGVSTAVWLAVFAIQRYAVAIEAVSGLLLVVAIARLSPGRMAAPAALAATVLALAATRPPDWWRRPWPGAWTAAPPAELIQPAAFAVVAHPIGYWASALPEASRFYTVFTAMGLAGGGVLARQRAEGLAHPPGGRIWILGYEFPMDESSRTGLAEQGLAPSPPCVRARSLWWVDTVACRAARVGPRPRAAADLPLGVTAAFTGTGTGWIYLGTGWSFIGPSGTASQGAASELVIWPARTGHPLALDLTLAAVAGAAPGPVLDVLLDGAPAAQWTVPDPAAPRTVCVPDRAPDTLSVVLRPTGRAPGFELRTMQLREARAGEC